MSASLKRMRERRNSVSSGHDQKMKTTTKTIRTVDYNELNREIESFLKEKEVSNEFCVVVEECLSNDSSKTFNVDGKLTHSDHKYYIPRILDGKFEYQTRTILNWMCSEGRLEAGEYLVEISW